MLDSQDVSLDELKIFYKTADGGVNEYFDHAIRDLANKYGLKILGSGMELGTRIRDVVFIRNS